MLSTGKHCPVNTHLAYGRVIAITRFLPPPLHTHTHTHTLTHTHTYLFNSQQSPPRLAESWVLGLRLELYFIFSGKQDLM